MRFSSASARPVVAGATGRSARGLDVSELARLHRLGDEDEGVPGRQALRLVGGDGVAEADVGILFERR